MEAQLHTPDAQFRSRLSNEYRAYVLLETGRLRAEALMQRYGHTDQLRGIHRELGTGGFVISEEFEPEHRTAARALAQTKLDEDGIRQRRHRSDTEVPALSRALAIMFAEAISASDALAGEIALHDEDDTQRDRLHLVHAHVMAACERLDEHLTALELEAAALHPSL